MSGQPLLRALVVFLVTLACLLIPIVFIGTSVSVLKLMSMVLVGAVMSSLMVYTSIQNRPPWQRKELPLAYRADLRPHLADEFRHLAAARPEATSPAGAPVADAPSAPRDPLAALHDRVEGQLAALGQAIAARAHELPDVALNDLRDNLAGLKRRAAALEAEGRRLQGLLTDGDADAAAVAASRVEARLARLDSLEKAGQKPDSGEQRALLAALEGHRSDQTVREAAEAGVTRVMAALLEIGAAANHSRRVLAEEPDPAVSSERLVGRLRQEVAAAAEALGEVDARRATRAEAAKNN